MNALNQYLDIIQQTLQLARTSQAEALDLSAQLLADASIQKRNLFIFGCNHAGLLAKEMYYRTGGMVNINPITAPGLNLDIVPVTMTSQMERLSDYGTIIIDSSPLSKGDVIIIHSVSGRNTVTIDAALRAKEIGAKVIALTNLETSRTVASRHRCGKNLYEIADIVIDNCGCKGDASIQLEGITPKVGPTSTVIGAALLNAIAVEAVSRILAAGHEAPVFLSANLDEGDEYNDNIIQDYKQNIFYM